VPYPLPVHYRLSKPTWLVGVNYKVSDKILTYAKVNTGYIAGGVLSGFSYNTETAVSYEVGLKADFWDGRARTNLALYHAIYHGLQFPTTDAGLNRILNYGNARARGAELEVTLVPTDGWTFTGNLGLTDFKLKSVDPKAAVGLTTQLVGVVATNRPKWTSSVSLQYDTPEFKMGGHGFFRMSADYKSGYFPNARGFDDNGDGKFNSADPTWDIIHNGPKAILNARAGITEFPVGNVMAELAVWSRNLTDNKSVQFETFVLGYSASYERARTIGVDLTLDF
jgi:iron complex outermembrane receptor protein